MAGILSKEARALQNPALGSVLLWTFAKAYYNEHPLHAGPPVPLLFIVLPLVLPENIRNIVLATQPRSGLRMFAEKFTSTIFRQSDVIAGLQHRVQLTRGLTLESLQILLQCQMGSLDINTATVIPAKARGLSQQLPEELNPLKRAAERLGHWTAPLSFYETAATLKVAF